LGPRSTAPGDGAFLRAPAAPHAHARRCGAPARQRAAHARGHGACEAPRGGSGGQGCCWLHPHGNAALLLLTVAAAAAADPARLRAAFTERLAVSNASAGSRLQPIFGLPLADLAEAPPADVSVHVSEGGGAGGSGKHVMMAHGAQATALLLTPRPAGSPSVRIIIGNVRGDSVCASFEPHSATCFLRPLAGRHGQDALSRLDRSVPRGSRAGDDPSSGVLLCTPAVIRGPIDGRTLRDEYRYARVLVIRLRDARPAGDGSPFSRAGLTVAEAAAVEVARLLDVSSAVPGASPGTSPLSSSDPTRRARSGCSTGSTRCPGQRALQRP